MEFKIPSFMVVIVATVATGLQHPSFYQNSFSYVTAGEGHDTQGAGYNLINVDGFERQSNLPVSYHPLPHVESQQPSWGYLIPIENSHAVEIGINNSEADEILPLAAPWNYNVPVKYSTSATPTTGSSQPDGVPFGYVRPVAKITVPPGYKIH